MHPLEAETARRLLRGELEYRGRKRERNAEEVKLASGGGELGGGGRGQRAPEAQRRRATARPTTQGENTFPAALAEHQAPCRLLRILPGQALHSLHLAGRTRSFIKVTRQTRVRHGI